MAFAILYLVKVPFFTELTQRPLQSSSCNVHECVVCCMYVVVPLPCNLFRRSFSVEYNHQIIVGYNPQILGAYNCQILVIYNRQIHANRQCFHCTGLWYIKVDMLLAFKVFIHLIGDTISSVHPALFNLSAHFYFLALHFILLHCAVWYCVELGHWAGT